MAYNTLGGSSGFIKPVILAFVAASILVGGAFLAITMFQPARTDGATRSTGTSGSFTAGFLKAFVPIFRGSCVKSADASLTRQGFDTATDGMGVKIETYCSCATDQFATELTIPELIIFKFNPSAEPAASKIKNIMEKCQEKAG